MHDILLKAIKNRSIVEITLAKEDINNQIRKIKNFSGNIN